MRIVTDEFLRSPLGGLLLHRWFDFSVLRLLTGFVLPCQRLAALAESVAFDRRRFRDAGVRLPFWVGEARLTALLDSLGRAHAEMEDTERHARDLIGSDVAAAQFAAADRARAEAASAYLMGRLRFAEMSLGTDGVAFAVPPETEVAAAFGAFHADPGAMFAPGPEPAVFAESPAFPLGGSLARVLRFEVPGAPIPGPALARVYEPIHSADAPTLIHAHGIAIDGDQLGFGMDEVTPLTARGVRVIRLVSPWHGRRRERGWWSGERVLAEAPLGTFRFMATMAREFAALIDWARAQGRGRVAIGGFSLGALASQLAAVHCARWPAALRPDALLLITTDGRIDRVAFQGTLTRKLGVDRALAAAGWSQERMEHWQTMLDAERALPLDPARVVLAIGGADEVTLSEGGRALARIWNLPERNVFERPAQGHFSVPLGLMPDDAPFARLADILHGRE